MKKVYFLGFLLFSSASFAQYKKDGTPDMRYKENKEMYGGYSTKSTNNYNYGGDTYQSGYSKSNGTYVDGHYKTKSNETNWDNYSTKGNTNIYNGTSGSRARDYSVDALNYGGGNTINTGPSGGQYYYNSNGNKTYVPKQP
jgi:hypothetical protein